MPHLATWFGDEAVTELSLKETRVEVLRLLNSAVHVMNTAEPQLQRIRLQDAAGALEDVRVKVYLDAELRGGKGQIVTCSLKLLLACDPPFPLTAASVLQRVSCEIFRHQKAPVPI